MPARYRPETRDLRTHAPPARRRWAQASGSDRGEDHAPRGAVKEKRDCRCIRAIPLGLPNSTFPCETARPAIGLARGSAGRLRSATMLRRWGDARDRHLAGSSVDSRPAVGRQEIETRVRLAVRLEDVRAEVIRCSRVSSERRRLRYAGNVRRPGDHHGLRSGPRAGGARGVCSGCRTSTLTYTGDGRLTVIELRELREEARRPTVAAPDPAPSGGPAYQRAAFLAFEDRDRVPVDERRPGAGDQKVRSGMSANFALIGDDPCSGATRCGPPCARSRPIQPACLHRDGVRRSQRRRTRPRSPASEATRGPRISCATSRARRTMTTSVPAPRASCASCARIGVHGTNPIEGGGQALAD